MSIYNVVHLISTNIQKTSYGMKVHDILVDIGLRDKIHIYKNWRASKNNELDIETKKYFDDNILRISKVESWLEDEESKFVYRQMIKFRYTNNYNDLPKYNYSNQYFVDGIFLYSEGECFIDCGAYIGDTVNAFKNEMKKHMITQYDFVCFEPDDENYEQLKKKHGDGKLIKAGCWAFSSLSLCFENGMETAGKIIENPTGDNYIKIPVVSIDDCPECKKATFIKMDIEGAEYQALLGAKATIQTNKPKLAICIYHSNEDMIRIAELIHEFVPEYRLMVRQHCNSCSETVLYARI